MDEIYHKITRGYSFINFFEMIKDYFDVEKAGEHAIDEIIPQAQAVQA